VSQPDSAASFIGLIAEPVPPIHMQRIHALVSFALLLTLGWFALSGFAQTEDKQESNEAVATAHTVYLVRHAEKATDDPRDPNLSEPGVERAQELAHVLGKANVTHLFSTAYKRTRATLAPLAEAMGLEVDSYSPRDMGQLVERLRGLPAGSVTVVAGHSNTTPGLFKALSGVEGVDLEPSQYGPMIPDDGYDRLFSVTLGEVEGAVRCLASVELRFGKP
jgi:2,3-bisphosphoglycerate-dependent phosphoglycerate mutase